VNDLPAIVFLPAHALVVVAAAWLLVRTFLPAAAGRLEHLLAWGWSFIAVIAGTGVVLGGIGGLSATGFWTAHLVALLLLAVGRRARWPGDWVALRRLGHGVGNYFRTAGGEAGLAALLLVLVLGLVALSLWAEPVVYDALTYRLPRIGQWLQDGRIGLVAADEPRINYMPVVPDLVMAWFIAGARAGFDLSAVAQALGGVLTVGATVGLARQTGLGRSAALGAGLLLFGMANVVPQFTSVHTDLFTTGIFAVAIYLWLAALRRGEGSVLAGLGAGLALGSKGTLFYLAPGALLWVGWLAWQHPLRRTQWGRTILAGAAGVVLFAAPVYVRNWQIYGGPFGPAEHMRMHHGPSDNLAGNLEKLKFNLLSSLAQVFEPNSQPFWWRAPARAMGEAIAQRLPEHDGHTLEDINRRGTLLEIMARASPDADATSCGVLSLGLFGAGFVTAVFSRRREGAILVTVWSAGVGVFLVFFHAMQQWHPFGFRYFVLVAPWMAVVAAWWLCGLPRLVRLPAWGIAGLTVAAVAWSGTMQTYQSGWPAISRPERSRGYFVFSQWREWADALDERSELMRIALPDRRPLAAFYRQPSARRVLLQHQPAPGISTAEEFIGPEKGWVILPAAQFMGREGRVMARTWLFEGDETSPFSLAAYRARRPGELSPPVLYRRHQTVQEKEIQWDLLVKAWEQPGVRLQLSNPGASAWSYRIISAAARTEGDLPAGGQQVLTLQLPANEISQVLVVLHSREDRLPEAPGPSVKLLP
jgi:hypothetical protein